MSKERWGDNPAPFDWGGIALLAVMGVSAVLVAWGIWTAYLWWTHG